MSKTAFLYAGQGAQVVGMGKDLADAYPDDALKDYVVARKTLGSQLTLGAGPSAVATFPEFLAALEKLSFWRANPKLDEGDDAQIEAARRDFMAFEDRTAPPSAGEPFEWKAARRPRGY